jgi:hypothetical protein
LKVPLCVTAYPARDLSLHYHSKVQASTLSNLTKNLNLFAIFMNLLRFG